MPSKTPRTTKPGQSDQIVDVAMRLASVRPWSKISLGEIAAEAKLSPAELYEHFDGHQAILDAVMRRVDMAMMATAPDFTEPPRDRLFDVLMRRFDALAPYKQAIVNMADRLRMARPDAMAAVVPAVPRFSQSVRLALEAAGITTSGVVGLIRIKAVGLALLQAVKIWLDDESEDHAKTMAALDRALKRIEPLLKGMKSVAPASEADATVPAG